MEDIADFSIVSPTVGLPHQGLRRDAIPEGNHRQNKKGNASDSSRAYTDFADSAKKNDVGQTDELLKQ